MKNKTAENMSLYERAIKALPADHIDHHESDLYLKAFFKKHHIDEIPYEALYK